LKHGGEDETASDDASKKDIMPSIVVEPLLNVAGDAGGAPLKQTSALAGKPATPSTSGAVPAPKVLKVNKLNVKKLSL
jgi:hypothetical protein